MPLKPYTVDLEKPFAEQEFGAFLQGDYDGPVDEALLYRLLSIVELAVRSQLEPDEALHGLVLGYDLFTTDPPKKSKPKDSQPKFVKSYWVGWGWQPAYAALSESHIEEDENQSQDIQVLGEFYTDNDEQYSLVCKFILELTKLTEVEIIRQTAAKQPELAKGKELRTWIFALIEPALATDSSKLNQINDRFSLGMEGQLETLAVSQETLAVSQRIIAVTGRGGCCPNSTKYRKFRGHCLGIGCTSTSRI